MIYKLIKVEAYSGYRKNERPLTFYYQDEHREVREILDRWYESNPKAGSPNFAHFKVLASDKKVYFLRYNSRFETWAVRIE
jgi:hypothetical protein